MVVAGRKVLVVEDDDGLRPALERLLDAAGSRGGNGNGAAVASGGIS